MVRVSDEEQPMPFNAEENDLPLFRQRLAVPPLDGIAPTKDEANATEKSFSKYIVYVDESGDHGMQSIDKQYPLFVLAFCVFHKGHYAEKIVPALEAFKFKHFGHDQIVLHETEIRKEKGDFRIFPTRASKDRFIGELTEIIAASNFILVSCVIDKKRLKEQSDKQSNPYHIALGFCLETLYEFLREKGEEMKLSHVVVERRGKREDNELELEFRRICDGQNRFELDLPFEVIFADKMVMSSGLQLADLVARPIGIRILRPDQLNRAFDVLKHKFFCEGGRQNVGTNFEDWGLKIHPPTKSERPR